MKKLIQDYLSAVELTTACIKILLKKGRFPFKKLAGIEIKENDLIQNGKHVFTLRCVVSSEEGYEEIISNVKINGAVAEIIIGDEFNFQNDASFEADLKTSKVPIIKEAPTIE